VTDDEIAQIAKLAREYDWRKRYAARIVAVTTCSDDVAQMAADAVELDGTFHSVDDDPVEAADDEMAEWTADE
jgi:hypothetical protein